MVSSPPVTRTTSTLLKSLQVILGIISAFCCSGLVFGFAALYDKFLQHGIFKESCPLLNDDELSPAASEYQQDSQTSIRTSQSDSDQSHYAYPCSSQRFQLSLLFTTASTLLNLVALPSGFLLDKLGPRKSAILSALTCSSGIFLFGYFEYYYIGFIMIAVSGPLVYMATVSFSNYFPKNVGLVSSAGVGAFDASSFVFVMLNWGIGRLQEQGNASSDSSDSNTDNHNESDAFNTIFLIYGFIPLGLSLLMFLLYPDEAVQLVLEEDKPSQDLVGPEPIVVSNDQIQNQSQTSGPGQESQQQSQRKSFAVERRPSLVLLRENNLLVSGQNDNQPYSTSPKNLRQSLTMKLRHSLSGTLKDEGSDEIKNDSGQVEDDQVSPLKDLRLSLNLNSLNNCNKNNDLKEPLLKFDSIPIVHTFQPASDAINHTDSNELDSHIQNDHLQDELQLASDEIFIQASREVLRRSRTTSCDALTPVAANSGKNRRMSVSAFNEIKADIQQDDTDDHDDGRKLNNENNIQISNPGPGPLENSDTVAVNNDNITDITTTTGPKYDNLPLTKQILTPEFFLFAFCISVYMIRLNFFISEVTNDVDALYSNNDSDNNDTINTSAFLSHTFSLMLPAFGILSIPGVGFLTDTMGVTASWTTLWLLFLVYQILLELGSYLYINNNNSNLTRPMSNQIQNQNQNLPTILCLLSFCCFCFSRPLVYTMIAIFTGRTFGFRNFGTIYGLVCSVAGSANGLGLYGLNLVLNEMLDSESSSESEDSESDEVTVTSAAKFSYINWLQTGIQFFTVLMPIYLVWDRKRTKVNK